MCVWMLTKLHAGKPHKGVNVCFFSCVGLRPVAKKKNKTKQKDRLIFLSVGCRRRRDDAVWQNFIPYIFLQTFLDSDLDVIDKALRDAEREGEVGIKEGRKEGNVLEKRRDGA